MKRQRWEGAVCGVCGVCEGVGVEKLFLRVAQLVEMTAIGQGQAQS